MIKSMTGFGSSTGKIDDIEVTIELKSVNSKYNDTNIHLPRNFLFAEEIIKSVVSSHISRGKIDVFVTVDTSKSKNISININRAVLEGYLKALNTISEEYNVDNPITARELSLYQEVLSLEKNEIDTDKFTVEIKNIAENALNDFDNMRISEGAKLKDDVLSKLKNIETLLSNIEDMAPETIVNYKARLLKKMNEILTDSDIDENRIIQEVAIFADKIAVDEETVRLHSHINQLKTMLASGSPIGRKIDFLIQEFNREANTIGSKCQNSDIAHTVVELKSEIEKIREQIQNIE